MKKFIILSISFIIIAVSSVSVFGGDVPESLLYEDTAQVFLGTVVNYTTKEVPSAPYTVIDTLECIPTEKIKGDVEVGAKQSYQRCYCSSIDFKPDIEYLFGYFNNNSVYIYEIESRKYDKFKLVDSDIHDMTKRFESYLNDGTFEKAEKERIEKIEKSTQSDMPSTAEANASQVHLEDDHQAFISQNLIRYIALGAATLAILIAGAVFMIKRKSK